MKIPSSRHPYLSIGAQNLIYAISKSGKGELDYFAPGGWWIGYRRTSRKYCMELLRLCLLRDQNIEPGNSHRVYRLASDAIPCLERKEEPLFLKALRERENRGV